jgi:hypothetical protein
MIGSAFLLLHRLKLMAPFSENMAYREGIIYRFGGHNSIFRGKNSTFPAKKWQKNECF